MMRDANNQLQYLQSFCRKYQNHLIIWIHFCFNGVLSSSYLQDSVFSQLVIKEKHMTESASRASVRTVCVCLTCRPCGYHESDRLHAHEWQWDTPLWVLVWTLEPSKHVFTQWEEVGRLKGGWLERETESSGTALLPQAHHDQLVWLYNSRKSHIGVMHSLSASEFSHAR